MGETEKVFRGGYSRLGIQSEIAIRPIIAIAGSEVMARMLRPELPLGERDNSLLFRRDQNTCAYCAVVFARHHLTRDHIHPQSRGGKSSWQNCAAACRECNGRKGDKLLSECGMELVYLPYVPSRAEHFILSGRNILADQHEYLAANLPRHSRVRLQ